ncbi:SRPBCC family protein [Massilia antarctica]|uniref:SRPBCC family protein n=2 Tax=Massilia antarctica TaxID=2765360 RepID=A0AA48WFW9_9BURK|nr:SRPBCC family protein [Massilia antarctica]
MFPRILFCCFLAYSAPVLAQSRLEVTVRRVDLADQHMFEVGSSGEVRAAPAAVWKVLTNYDRMADFVPDLKTSKVLSRTGNKAIIEQFGVASFLFIRRDIHLIVQATEEAMTSIDIGLITGDMRVYQCRWELIPVPETGGTRIVYSGKLVPKFYVPGMLGANIIRSDIEHMMKAVLARLERGDTPAN